LCPPPNSWRAHRVCLVLKETLVLRERRWAWHTWSRSMTWCPCLGVGENCHCRGVLQLAWQGWGVPPAPYAFLHTLEALDTSLEERWRAVSVPQGMNRVVLRVSMCCCPSGSKTGFCIPIFTSTDDKEVTRRNWFAVVPYIGPCSPHSSGCRGCLNTGALAEGTGQCRHLASFSAGFSVL